MLFAVDLCFDGNLFEVPSSSLVSTFMFGDSPIISYHWYIIVPEEFAVGATASSSIMLSSPTSAESPIMK